MKLSLEIDAHEFCAGLIKQPEKTAELLWSIAIAAQKLEQEKGETEYKNLIHEIKSIGKISHAFKIFFNNIKI